MLCLYCEAELTPFRGWFDEDFCCRDHRDKYLASFRKALNQLPPDEAPADPSAVAGPVTEILVVEDPAEISTYGEVHRDPAEAGFVPMPAAPVTGASQILTACAIAVARPELASPMTAVQWEQALPLAALAEPAPGCRQLESRPVAAGEIPFVLETCLPVFAASTEALRADEAPDSDVEEPLKVAPPLIAGTAPVDRPMASAASPQFLPPPIALSTAKPAGSPAPAPLFASSGTPNLAPEIAAQMEVPRQDAASASAEPRTHEPLRPAFGNVARIKRWRLRISFAKPA